VDNDHLAQVISHATAPAFLLSAVVGLVSILILRTGTIIDRIRSLNDISENDTARVRLKSDIRRLKRRETLLNKAIKLAISAGISTTLLMVLAFAFAFLGLRHEPVAAVLFVVAVALLGASLCRLAQEMRIALHDLEHYR
jgi:hypothetical protein